MLLQTCLFAASVHGMPCRTLGVAGLHVHAVSYEHQQAAENQQIASATPGSPAAVYKFADA